MKTQNKRAIVSLILLVTFIMMPVSAIIIHSTHGMALSHTWLHFHVLFGVVFIVAGIFHIVYNWKALKNYFFAKK